MSRTHSGVCQPFSRVSGKKIAVKEPYPSENDTRYSSMAKKSYYTPVVERVSGRASVYRQTRRRGHCLFVQNGRSTTPACGGGHHYRSACIVVLYKISVPSTIIFVVHRRGYTLVLYSIAINTNQYVRVGPAKPLTQRL